MAISDYLCSAKSITYICL